MVAILRGKMFIFLSKVNASYREEVLKIFYYNPSQSRFCDKIVDLVKLYGEPKLVKSDGKLTIRLNCERESYTIFMCRGPLIAAIAVYVLEKDGVLVVHLASNPSLGLTKRTQRVIPLRLFDYLKSRELFRDNEIKFGYIR
jgi:hypothetical protein